MSLARSEPSVCKNKLCDYEGTELLFINERFDENRVCPKCGFKTLARKAEKLIQDRVVSVFAESILELNKRALYGQSLRKLSQPDEEKQETKALLSVKEYNRRRAKERTKLELGTRSGIACPECDEELYFHSTDTVLQTYPPKKEVTCSNCGHTTTVLA